MKQAGNKSLATVIDKEEDFNFPLYLYTPRGTSLFSLFVERKKEIELHSSGHTRSLGHSDGGGGCSDFVAFQDGIHQYGSLQPPESPETSGLPSGGGDN